MARKKRSVERAELLKRLLDARQKKDTRPSLVNVVADDTDEEHWVEAESDAAVSQEEDEDSGSSSSSGPIMKRLSRSGLKKMIHSPATKEDVQNINARLDKLEGLLREVLKKELETLNDHLRKM